MFISTLVAVKLHLCGVKHLHELLLTEHWWVGVAEFQHRQAGRL